MSLDDLLEEIRLDIKTTLDALDPKETQDTFTRINEPYREWKKASFAENKLRNSSWPEELPCSNQTKKFYKEAIKSQKKLISSKCNKCPMRLECLVLALVLREEHGVWGGSTTVDRMAIIDDFLNSDPNFYRFWKPENRLEVIEAAKEYLKNNSQHAIKNTTTN